MFCLQNAQSQCYPPIVVTQISYECNENASFYAVEFFLSRNDVEINVLHKYDMFKKSNGGVGVYGIPSDKALTIEFGDGNGCFTQHEFAMPDCLEDRQLSGPIVDPELSKYKVLLPNAFTPNGDGANDYFRYVGNNIQSMKIGVFNRWGEMVFSSSDKNSIWDGTQNGDPLPTGTYAYMVEVVFEDGKTGYKNGTVTLFR